MIEFEKTQYFVALLLFPVLIIIYIVYKKWQLVTQNNFANPTALHQLKINKSNKNNLGFALFLGTILLVIVALANPKMGTNTETIKGFGTEIVLAMDVSKSMLCADVQPSRLEKAKQIANQLINNFKGDRVGIVTYAAFANTTLPMTTDYAMAKMQINSLNTNLISSQGTGIKKAIEVATTYFTSPKSSKVILLLTDGEDHQDDASTISDFAKDNGIKIITIGIGTTNGGTITYIDDMGNAQLKTDQEGNVVTTKLNEDILKDIAYKTSGYYVANGETNAVINQINNNLNKLEKTEFKSQQLTQKQPQFQWFLGLALVLLTGYFILKYVKNKK